MQTKRKEGNQETKNKNCIFLKYNLNNKKWRKKFVIKCYNAIVTSLFHKMRLIIDIKVKHNKISYTYVKKIKFK